VFLETFAFSENSSMLTRRVRLEVWSAPPAGASTAAALAAARAGGGGGGAFTASFASLTSMDGPAARREYFGGTAVNLDLTTEGAVQDRWYALGGGEGGEVRVRLAVVAGGPEDDDTQEVLDFCCGTLGSSTREALLVEVRFPPGGEGACGEGGVVSLAGPIAASWGRAVMVAPHACVAEDGPPSRAPQKDPTEGRLRAAAAPRSTRAPARQVLSARLQLPLSSMDSDDTDAQPMYRIAYHGASFISDPVPLGSHRRSRVGRLGLRERPGAGPGGVPARPGSVASVARPGSVAGAAPGAARPGSVAGGAAADGGRAGSPDALRAGSPTGRISPGDDILARATFVYSPEESAPGRRTKWIDHGLLIECCDADAAPGDEVMGSVEIDVSQRLALTDAGCWEGWLRLNKVRARPGGWKGAGRAGAGAPVCASIPLPSTRRTFCSPAVCLL
jgi:hypothetical protein